MISPGYFQQTSINQKPKMQFYGVKVEIALVDYFGYVDWLFAKLQD